MRESDSSAEDPAAEYSVSQLARVANISRSTLIYYESVGLIEPDRKEGSNYRSYTSEDMTRVMNAILLRKIGFGVDEIIEIQKGYPFSAANVGVYRERIHEQVEHLLAASDALCDYLDAKGDADWQHDEPPRFSIADVPTYRYRLVNMARGWDGIDNNPITDILLDNVPIASLGAVFTSTLFDRNSEIRWGRFVREDRLKYVDVDPDDLDTVGGCPCLVMRVWGGSCLYAPLDDGQRSEALAFMEEAGYRPDGPAFIAQTYAWEHCFYQLMQPVKKA